MYRRGVHIYKIRRALLFHCDIRKWFSTEFPKLDCSLDRLYRTDIAYIGSPSLLYRCYLLSKLCRIPCHIRRESYRFPRELFLFHIGFFPTGGFWQRLHQRHNCSFCHAALFSRRNWAVRTKSSRGACVLRLYKTTSFLCRPIGDARMP